MAKKKATKKEKAEEERVEAEEAGSKDTKKTKAAPKAGTKKKTKKKAAKKKASKPKPEEGDTPEDTKKDKRGAKKKPKKGKKDEEEEKEDTQVPSDIGYATKKKPELDKDTMAMLSMRRRRKAKKPNFRRQEWFRYKRLGEAWRKPRGKHSKMRTGKVYRTNVVSIGYGSPRKARGLHPSGFAEVPVHNINDLDGIDPKVQAARIGHSVGVRKRIKIEQRAEELGIRVLNRRVEL